MSRVDRPALKCDRCGTITEDIPEMGRFSGVQHSHMSGTDKWDLCPDCWQAFVKFIGGAE